VSSVSQTPIIVALDFPTPDSALELAQHLSPELCRVKVGKELFTRGGPALVEKLQARGFDVFLDLKYHDIPNTVAGAVKAAADLGVWMVNVHASGGRRMMEAAREATEQVSHPPLLIAVTVLTSMSAEDLHELGYNQSPQERVVQLARLAAGSGLDGVVCSAQEAPVLRKEMSDGFKLVTPGIRLPGDSADDQRRVVTPVDALSAGSDFLVIGRSITGAEEPLEALQQVQSNLAA
jgi:orotidine-5'-phosphate decarboxylase